MAFSADWLALREPADLAARDADLLRRAAACVTPDLAVLDLGSGTGSTARAFAAVGAADLNWRFLDNDAALLDVAAQHHPRSVRVLGDLGEVDALPLDGVGLVTASALLDLMPLRWLTALVRRLGEARIPFYAALNYDGKMTWTPDHPQDADITAAFNLHQRGDKGLGGALGPDSGAEAARQFVRQGFTVALRNSPWAIGPDHAALHAQLLDGIGSAADEAGCSGAADWTAARQAAVMQSHAAIGHTDLLALPAGYGS